MTSGQSGRPELGPPGCLCQAKHAQSLFVAGCRKELEKRADAFASDGIRYSHKGIILRVILCVPSHQQCAVRSCGGPDDGVRKLDSRPTTNADRFLRCGYDATSRMARWGAFEMVLFEFRRYPSHRP